VSHREREETQINLDCNIKSQLIRTSSKVPYNSACISEIFTT